MSQGHGSATKSFFFLTAPGQIAFALTGAFKPVELEEGWQPPKYWKTVAQKRRETLIAKEKEEQEKKGGQPASSGSSQETAVDRNAAENAGGEKGAVGEAVSKEAALADEGATAPLADVNDYILVDWYGAEGGLEDPENPHAWPSSLKGLFLGILMWLTFVVYMGASIVSPGIPNIVETFGVSDLVASLTIALYVLGYGLGPLLFAPLSEIPAIGRLPMYIAPLFLFFAVNFATIWTPTFGGLLAVRFITGFLASPALATGGASVGDVLSPLLMPLGLCLWVVAAYQGPGIGPVVVGYAVQNNNSWRWGPGIYQMFVAVCCILVFFLMPETSGPNILARRAARVRKVTGNDRYRSQSEIDQSRMSTRDIYSFALIKPFEITLKDPSVAYINIYISFLYAFYYLFFASFPLIFSYYGFPLGNAQLPYLAFCGGGTIFCALYMALYKYVVVPKILSGEAGEPEDALFPALPASILSVASLFALGWSANRTNFMAPIIFGAVFAGSNFVILQPLFAYLAMTYPVYAGSLFAANDAMRSTMAFGFLIAGDPLYKNLGIGPGSSLVGGLTALCVPPLFVLFKYGKKLRERSTFAVHSEI